MVELIVEGLLVSHDKKVSRKQVQIVDGIITGVGQNLGLSTHVFDDDHLVFPGFVDVHIHAREDEQKKQDHKENYNTVETAAINGGVAAVMAMPNTSQPLVTDELLAWHQQRTKGLEITILNYAGIGKGTSPLRANVAYKVYCGPSVGDLFFENEAQLRQALQHYRGKPVSFHVEDNDILQASKEATTHALRRPVECVNTCLKYVLEMIEDFELEAKLCHWSTGNESFDMIREHRERYDGPRTLLEVSPLHLYFDTDMLEEQPELWPYVQMNPALQSREHRMQLIEGLRTGFIDMIATDHAPHTLDEKFKNFAEKGMTNEDAYLGMRETSLEQCRALACTNGTSGTPQLDTYGAMCTWLMAEHGFTPQDIARAASYTPGMFANKFHEGPRFGEIERGYTGSLVVINPTTSREIRRNELGTRVAWSPFERDIIGNDLPGSVTTTIVKGKVYER